MENGSCLYLPVEQFGRPQDALQRDGYWELVLGATQKKIDDALQLLDLSDDHCIRLSRCSVAEAVALTGLSEAQAEQAIAREFSEPLIWQAGEPALIELQQQLERRLGAVRAAPHLSSRQGAVHRAECDRQAAQL